jgi:SAM-dependent methyltransferase
MIVAEPETRLAPQRCPLCGELQDIMVNGFRHPPGEAQAVVDQTRGYSFCNCRNIFFTNWANMLPAVYNPGYYAKYDQPEIRQAISQYVAQYGPIIREHRASGRVLEIGSVSPALLDAFAAQGYETLGMDIFTHPLGAHRLLVGDFESMALLPSADVIWASHILEHLHDPLGAVRKLHGMLGRGGLLFVAMPDPYAVDWSCPYVFAHWNLDEHHILWDLRSFCQVLEAAGFEILLANRNYEPFFVCTSDYHILAKAR